MNKTASCLALLVFSLAAHADLSDLKWMVGCWAQDGQDPGSVELWIAPVGGSMLGMNRTVTDGRTVAFEYLRIVEREDGGITLVASPSGQETARFQLVSMSEREVTFENPDHDFPQRIIYRLIDRSRLHGRIEGLIDGEERSADFPMTRMQCDSGHEPG
jgi:hypothetical protein